MSKHFLAAEIIAFAKRSPRLTIVVEGTTDSFLLRWIESQFGLNGAIVKTDGRDELFKTYELANDLKIQNVIFFADSDTYVYVGHPSKYGTIIFTDGYSIENDVLLGVNTSVFFGHELDIYHEAVNAFAQWFHRRIVENLKDNTVSISDNINSIIRIKGNTVTKLFCETTIPQSCPIWLKIDKEPEKYLRGKQLIALIHRIFTDPARGTNFNMTAILELLLKASTIKCDSSFHRLANLAKSTSTV